VTTTHSPTTQSIVISTPEVNSVEVSVTELGAGHPVLLLHGGGGPFTVAGFANLLAETEHARVFMPSHPGFGGTARPNDLTSIRALAGVYIALLDELDLNDVTIVGNSIGGWIAAEMAVAGSPRVSSVVLVDGVGIAVDGHPVADFFSLTFPELARLSYFDPEPFQIDPTSMSAEQLQIMAGNRNALAVYAGADSMMDAGLRERLSVVDIPVSVLWGEADQIADPDYGRAYATAIPGATFTLLERTGHMPQLETPQLLLGAVWEFAKANSAGQPVRD
jgi:pimeloyl-ACP methyl ester carboxylesterase